MFLPIPESLLKIYPRRRLLPRAPPQLDYVFLIVCCIRSQPAKRDLRATHTLQERLTLTRACWCGPVASGLPWLAQAACAVLALKVPAPASPPRCCGDLRMAKSCANLLWDRNRHQNRLRRDATVAKPMIPNYVSCYEELRSRVSSFVARRCAR